MTAAAATIYELWDVETANLISDYENEAATLQAIREGVAEDGADAWATVVLMRVEPGGMREPIAQGGDLIRRARGEDARAADD